MKAISNADYACLLRVLRELSKIKTETTKQKNAVGWQECWPRNRKGGNDE